MKKLNILAVMLLCFVFLFSCHNDDVTTPTESDAPSPKTESSNVSGDYDNYVLNMNEYETSINRYYVAPSVFGDEILALNTENYNDEINAKTILYNMETETEREIDIFAKNPQIYNGYIYYANHSLDLKDDHTYLIKRNLDTAEETIIYSVDSQGKRMGLSLSLSGNYLAWYEQEEGDETIFSDNGTKLGMSQDLIIFDLTKEQVAYNAKDVLTFSSRPALSDDNKVVEVRKSEDEYKITVIDFLTEKSIFERKIDLIPMFVDYNNGVLAYLFRSESINVIDTSLDKEILSLNGAFTENHIVDGRFLVYGTVDEVFVYDLYKNEIIFNSNENNELYEGARRFHHNGRFAVNHELGQVAYRYSDRTLKDAGKDIIVVFSFEKQQ